MSHPDGTTIERFVMGGLDDDAAFVAHVAECAECARKVQLEADVELAMLEVRRLAAATGELEPAAGAQAVDAPMPASFDRSSARSSLARRSLGPRLALAAFAAAAALALWVGRNRLALRHDTSEGAAVQVVSCPDGPMQLDCVAQAHRSRNRLEYPKGPLAALGSEPGLTAHVVPGSSDGIVPEVDEFFAKVETDLKTCAAHAIVVEDAPIRTGRVGIHFTIGANGGVEEAQSNISLDPLNPSVDFDAPAHADMALARCLGEMTRAFPFKGTGRPVRLSLLVMYVWRE